MKSILKSITLLCAVAFATVFLAGCDDKPATPPPAPEQVHPNS